jgi:hypothetical protein
MVLMLSMTVVIQVMITMLMRTQKSGSLHCEYLQQITVSIFFQSEKLICNFQRRSQILVQNPWRITIHKLADNIKTYLKEMQDKDVG